MQGKTEQDHSRPVRAARPSTLRVMAIAVLVGPPLTGVLMLVALALRESVKGGAGLPDILLTPLIALHPVGLMIAYMIGGVPAIVVGLAMLALARRRTIRPIWPWGAAAGAAAGLGGILVWSLFLLEGGFPEAFANMWPLIPAAAAAGALCGWWIGAGVPPASRERAP